ncbi:unnamed protein product, partial [Mesorhabditis spiculigera]
MADKPAPSSNPIASKALVISQFQRRLRENIKSLNDNFQNIVSLAKVNTEERAHNSSNSIGKMSEYETVRSEMMARAALIVRACDELQKLTTDIKEFLFLNDFEYLSRTIKEAERKALEIQRVHRARLLEFRTDLVSLSQDIDRELLDDFYLKD